MDGAPAGSGAPKCKLGKKISRKESPLRSSPRRQHCHANGLPRKPSGKETRISRLAWFRAIPGLLFYTKNPYGDWEEQRKREMHPRAVNKKKVATTKIKRENFAPHSRIAAREEKVFGIIKKGKRKRRIRRPGRGQAFLQNRGARIQPRKKNEEQKPKQQHR